MKLGHSSRNYAKAFFAFVTIGVVSACADAPTVAPEATVAAFAAPAAYTRIGGVKTFTVWNNAGTTQKIGAHTIVIPARAICAADAAYLAAAWDTPCTPVVGAVTITATTLYDNENHPYVDFQPALRFAPEKQVMLFLRNGRSSQATQLEMVFCNNLGVCIDESLTDPSLKAFRVGRTSLIGRRIKHFSGYAVNAGERCRGGLTEDDGTWMCESESMERRSGYMVASGKDAKQDEGNGQVRDDH